MTCCCTQVAVCPDAKPTQPEREALLDKLKDVEVCLYSLHLHVCTHFCDCHTACSVSMTIAKLVICSKYVTITIPQLCLMLSGLCGMQLLAEMSLCVPSNCHASCCSGREGHTAGQGCKHGGMLQLLIGSPNLHTWLPHVEHVCLHKVPEVMLGELMTG